MLSFNTFHATRSTDERPRSGRPRCTNQRKDESRFTLTYNDARERVWRRPGERFVDACVRQHDRHGGGSVMVWEELHLHGRTPLHLVQGNVTVVRYRDKIVRRIVLSTLQAMGPGAILQDDNATPHCARVVTGILQQHQVA